ncbi:MAG: hypothetical protein ACRC3B_20720 [Bacteroidia bacterium]
MSIRNCELIRSRFRSNLKSGTPEAAVAVLCDELGLSYKHAVFVLAPEIRNAYAIAKDYNPIVIQLSPEILAENFDFGLLTRILAHELMHVEQRTRFFPMKNHDEREFLAYADTLFRTDLPPIASKSVKKMFLEKGLSYYPRLPKLKQWWYSDVKRELDKLAL